MLLGALNEMAIATPATVTTHVPNSVQLAAQSRDVERLFERLHTKKAIIDLRSRADQPSRYTPDTLDQCEDYLVRDYWV